MKLILLMFLPIVSLGQKIYSGTIVNKITKTGIPYATVGLIQQKKGVNANEQGAFLLTGPLIKGDSLRISSVGYETLIISVDEITDTNIFELTQNQFTLNEIVISNYNKKIVENLNEFATCGSKFYVSTGTITQIAQHFQAPKSNSLLTQINICKQASNCLFRIRIYSMDSITRKPLKDLINDPIEIKSSNKYIRVNLEKRGIIIPDRDFFIAIEWLYIPLNEYKAKTRINGKKITYSNYYPGIAFINQNSISLLNNYENAWVLDFAGQWYRITKFYDNINFLISPEISY